MLKQISSCNALFTLSEGKSVYTCSKQSGQTQSDLIIIRIGVMAHTFKQTFIEGIHGVALILMNEK